MVGAIDKLEKTSHSKMALRTAILALKTLSASMVPS
jgi:hypothetical protein